MDLPIFSRGFPSSVSTLSAPFLLALLLGSLLPATPARAEDDGLWTVEILGQSDSRAELRPCT